MGPGVLVGAQPPGYPCASALPVDLRHNKNFRYSKYKKFGAGAMGIPYPAYPMLGRRRLDGGGITWSSKIRSDMGFTAGTRLVTHGLPNLTE
jgi:hypothetical protein